MQRAALIVLLGLLPGLLGAQSGRNDWAVVTSPLQARVFYLPEYTEALPDFSQLSVQGSFTTTQINVPVRSWRAGYPGVPGRFEWFAIEYLADVLVAEAGGYRFELASDDGSRLYIDDRLVIDNDSIHEAYAVRAEVQLTKGPHRIRVEYMQGPRFELGLVLRWAFEDYPLQVFALSPGRRRT